MALSIPALILKISLPPANESEMMMEIFKYTERVVNMVRPRRLLFIAIDGVAPRAKMNQQRSRRFRSAMDAKETDEKKAELQVLLRRQRAERGEPEEVEQVIKKTWDSNVITPGTPFMFILAQSIRFWCQWKLNTDPAWAELKVIISDASVPGEGEHKIMQFIRSQRSDPEYDPNARHVMYGLDADLIMLGIATHEPHFRFLREDVEIRDAKAKTCRLCGQPGHYADNCRGTAKVKSGEFDEKGTTPDLKPFVFLHVPILREYLGAEMYVPGQTFRFDLERALDDWVFMCFFVGNDFLPHLPSLDIHEDGIDKLIAIWRDNVPVMGGYLTCDGEVDLARAQVILEGLAKQEDAIFRKRRENDERRERNQERRKRQDEQRDGRNFKRSRDSPDYSQGAKTDATAPPPMKTFAISSLPQTSSINYNMVVNRGAAEKAISANKSAAAVLKEKMLAQQSQMPTKDDAAVAAPTPETSPSALGKRKADLMADEEDNEADDGTPGRSTPVTEQPVKKKFDPDNPPPDTVRLWEEGYADRYYEQKFHVSPTDVEFRHQVARSYVEGLSWVLLYYFQGCPSWTWYYPYHYAPFAADFVDLEKMNVKFDKGKPFRPYEQLMGVLPASSNHALPKAFHPLMTDEDSDIVDFYPEEFDLDMNGKKQSWKAIVLLPFIDEKRLLAAMATKYPELTEDESMRNEPGKDALIISDKHPLYDDLAMEFYSKKAKSGGAKEVKLSMCKARLAGQAIKNEAFLPHMDLRGPEEDISLDPAVDDDCTLSVHYDLPPKTHVHKSMLFPGVILPPAVLDKSDVAILKSKARNSGRDFGGAPLYDNSRRDHMDTQFRQPRINYAADRPPLPQNGARNGNGAYPPPPPPDPRSLDPSNPFAAFLDPKFAPGMPNTRAPGPPPPIPQQYQGYNNGNGGYDRRDNRAAGGYSRDQHGGQQQYGGNYQQPPYQSQQGGYDNRNRQDNYNRGGGYENGGQGYPPPQHGQGYHQGGGGQNGGYGRR